MEITFPYGKGCIVESAAYSKKILSVFFAFVLAVTLVPSAALADDTETVSTDSAQQDDVSSGSSAETDTDSAQGGVLRVPMGLVLMNPHLEM